MSQTYRKTSTQKIKKGNNEVLDDVHRYYVRADKDEFEKLLRFYQDSGLRLVAERVNNRIEYEFFRASEVLPAGQIKIRGAHRQNHKLI